MRRLRPLRGGRHPGQPGALSAPRTPNVCLDVRLSSAIRGTSSARRTGHACAAVCPRRWPGRRRSGAETVVDRLLHHATTVNIKGDFYRLREKQKAGLVRSTLTAPSEL